MLSWESRDACFQLGSEAWTTRQQGRVDEAPAIKGDTCIEAYVAVGFGEVASKDGSGAGLLRRFVAVAQSLDQYA